MQDVAGPTGKKWAMGLVIGAVSFVVVLGLIRISNSIFYFYETNQIKKLITTVTKVTKVTKVTNYLIYLQGVLITGSHVLRHRDCVSPSPRISSSNGALPGGE